MPDASAPMTRFSSLAAAVRKAVMPAAAVPSSRAGSPVLLLIAAASALRCLAWIAPEAQAAEAPIAMVVSESEPASEAGLKILRSGGNAVDAACATALAMGVTNASSCGIGGGGFMLVYLARTREVFALDYRETAPAAASATMYLRDGRPDQEAARAGPLSIAVPGEIAGIDAALGRFGSMKFSAVAAPAIALARNGFPASDHLAWEIARTAPTLARDPGLKAVFLNPDGTPRKQGDKIVEKDLAATLERLADRPAENFYKGPVAREIAAYLSAHRALLSAGDLAAYRPAWRMPLHRAHEEFEVYAMPPPSSGGVVLEMLGILEPGKIAALGADSPPYIARLIEVMRLGFIDREQYGDPEFVRVPIEMLLSPEHLKEVRWRSLRHAPAPRVSSPAHDHGTAHLCVVDKEGNVVSLTTTINTPFGAKMMVSGLGIILNDEMDDFAVAPGVPNVYGLIGTKANAIAPGKRALSSMSPLIVTRKGRPVLVLGGSGGPTIISGVLQIALDVLDLHMDPGQAEELPRVHEQASPDAVVIESKMPAATTTALKEMGYKVVTMPALGAIGAIAIAPGKLRGAFDPRKGGGAAGY
jgi:gamma-glutamyltranspeptidase / glutathione hydrolase